MAKAGALMRANDIDAVLIEAGSSLVYFTGIHWWRSERLTGAVITREVAGFEVSLAGDEGQPMHITRLDHSHGAAAEAGFTMQVSRHRGQVLAFSMKSATIAPKLDPITKQPQEQVLFRARLDKSAISRGVCIGSAVFAAPPPSHAVGDAPGLSDAQNRRHLSLSVWMPKARCAPAPHRRFHWAPLLAIAAVLPLAALCAHRWHAGDNAMRSIARKMA